MTLFQLIQNSKCAGDAVNDQSYQFQSKGKSRALGPEALISDNSIF